MQCGGKYRKAAIVRLNTAKDSPGIARLNTDARQSPFHSLQTSEKKQVLLLALWWPSIAGIAIPHLGHSVLPLAVELESRELCMSCAKRDEEAACVGLYRHGGCGQVCGKAGKQMSWEDVYSLWHFTQCSFVHFHEESSSDHPLFKIQLVVSQPARISNPVFLFFFKLLFCFPFCGKRPSFV